MRSEATCIKNILTNSSSLRSSAPRYARCRFNAKRASLVQSRIKAIEKLDLEAPDNVEIEPVWRFSIENPEPLGIPIISVNDIDFDYDKGREKEEYLLKKVNFGIDLQVRRGGC